MTKIELVKGEHKEKFTVKKAQNILYIQSQMRTKGGWMLPENSPYEYKDNALIKRPSSKNCTKQAPAKEVTDGDKARGETKISHSDDS